MRKDLFAMSTETVNLVEQLSPKPSLAQRFGFPRSTLGLIQKVRDTKEPGALPSLLQFCLSGDRTVREAARTAVHDLLVLLPIESLLELDDRLRQTGWNVQYRLLPKEIPDLQISSDSDRVFAALFASHANGYVRAEALRLLGNDHSTVVLPFILIRLVDWVDQVRTAAEFQLQRFLRPEYARTLVECLPLLDRLRNSTRFNPSISGSINDLLGQLDCSAAILDGMDSVLRNTRRQCFRLAVTSPAFSAPNIINKAVGDEDVLIRYWAFTFVVETLPQEWDVLRSRAALDPHPPVRRLAFESLESDGSATAKDFLPFLLDRAVAIRRACQAHIANRFDISSAEFYRSRIRDFQSYANNVCVMGLAETGTLVDVPLFNALLLNSRAGTRRAAIRALRAIGQDENSSTFVNILISDVPSVALEAATTLFSKRELLPEAVWKTCLRNSDSRVHLGTLNLVQRHARKWSQLAIYLDTLANQQDQQLISRVRDLLLIWVGRFNSSFAQPSEDEKVTLPTLLTQAKPKLPFVLSQQLDLVIT